MLKVFCAIFIFLSMPLIAFCEEYLPEGDCEQPVINNVLQDDELIKNIKIYNSPKVQNYRFEDELLKYIDYKTIRPPVKVDLSYDFSSVNKIIIPIKPQKFVSSKNASAGDFVEFVVIRDVKLNDKVTVSAGTRINAKVEFVQQSQLKGEAGILIIDKFQIKGFPEFKPEGEIYKVGANRSLWILPLAKVANIFTFVGGYSLYFIKGGEAKMEPHKTYEIYLWTDY